MYLHKITNEDKNELLKRARNLSFEMVELELRKDKFIGPIKNKAHPNQHIIIVSLNNYPCIVPFVVDGDIWFLKTIYPSRKYKGKI